MKTHPKPLDIAVDLKKGEVRFKWQDGRLTALSLEFLRANCPCAMCAEARNKAASEPLYVLPPVLINPGGKLEKDRPVEIVGQYGLQFFWADGHRAGIYTYEYLHGLQDKL